MSLPPELLNRVNKELKFKVDKALGEIQRLRSLSRLEKEVQNVTTQKLSDAKDQLKSLQSIAEKQAEKASVVERTAAVLSRESEKLKGQFYTLQVNLKDLEQKVSVCDKTTQDAKKRLIVAEESSANNEQTIAQWIEENRTTNWATSLASRALAEGDARIKELRRDAELLKTQVRQVEDTVAEERATTAEIEREIQEARDSRIRLERDKREVMVQITESQTRQTEADIRSDELARKAKELQLSLAQKRAELEQTRIELKSLEDAGRSEERSVAKVEAEKNRLAQAIQKEIASFESLDAQIRVTEAETMVAVCQKGKRHHELKMLRQSLLDQTAKLDSLLSRRAELEIQLKELECTTGDSTLEEKANNALLRAYESELAQLSRAVERGWDLIQTNIRERRADCEVMDSVSTEISSIRKLLRQKSDRESVLTERIAELVKVCEVVDNEMDATKQKIAEVSAAEQENQSSIRQERREQIEILKRELDEWERTVRQNQRSVDFARSALRKNTDDSCGICDIARDLQRDVDQLTIEIQSLFTELESLAIEKMSVAEKGENAFWLLETAKQKAANLAHGLTEAMDEVHLLEAHRKVEDSRLESEREGKLIELHAHEEDRRRMNRRLAAASQQTSLLQSRYEDLMRGLQQKVITEPEDQKATDLKGGLMTPEEIEARHILQRAVERERLMETGNSLDDQIVQLEQKNAQLDKLIGRMRDSVQQDHLLLTTGSPEALLLLESGNGALRETVEQELAEENKVLLEIRESLLESDQQRKSQYIEEGAHWENVCHALSQRLNSALREYDEKVQELKELREQKDKVVAVCRGLERKLALNGTCRDPLTNVDSKHRLSMMVLEKQRTLQSNPIGLQRLKLTAAFESFDGLLREATRRISRVATVSRNTGCYFTFRSLCDKYGLEIPSTGGSGEIPVGARASSQHDPLRKGDRKATKSLVVAAQKLAINGNARIR